MDVIINRIINVWKRYGVLKDDEDIYIFGIKLFISESASFLTVCILSVTFNRGLNGILYLASFATLRKYCGGYHAKTYISCYMSFVLIYMLSEVISRFIVPSTAICLFIFSSVIIFLIAPVDTKQKRISYNHRRKAKEIVRMELIVLFIFEILLADFQASLSVTLSMVLTINAILLLIQYILNLEDKKNEKI